MAIKVAKSGYQGDPGLFGFIGKALGGIAKVGLGAVGGFLSGGPAGAIRGGYNVLAGGKPQVLVSQRPAPGTNLTSGNIPNFPSLPGIGIPGAGRVTVPFGSGGLQQPYGPSSGPLVGAPSGAACDTRGYHHNKSTYYTKKYGVIQKGTVCVKNRRRNPLNPRALSHALARLESAKKATACLARYSIREKKCSRCG